MRISDWSSDVCSSDLKVVIENWPEDRLEELEAVNNPEDPGAGSRTIRFGREIWVEQDDFMEDAPKKFFRLPPGQEVRLRYAYFRSEERRVGKECVSP